MDTVTKSQSSPKREIPESSASDKKYNQPLTKKLKLSALKTFSFSYIPDPSLYQGGTWREEELLGHNSLAYPCAELIDNSLMATKDNKEKIIDIHLVKRTRGDMVFIVCDNGIGMDVEGLQNLAVFAHAPKYRNNSNSVLDTKDTKEIRYINSHISKFGVGLKNAAFHMGNNVIVITKREDNEKVMEFNMNISEMRNKYKESREKAYEGKVFERMPGDVENSMMDFSKPSESIKNLILAERDKKHFTTIIISEMRENPMKSLDNKEKRKLFKRNLASLYHYYLNGVYGKNASAQEKILSDSLLVKAKINFNYHCELKKTVKTKILANVKGDVQSLNNKLSYCTPFKFELVLPNKDPVVGVINYYPFVNDEETIPPFTHSNNVNAEPDRENSSQIESGRNFKREENDTYDPIFSCFWQGRQIPFTNVHTLQFIKKIPTYLRKRLRGALFMNETFAVNPQKNIFTDDLNEVLNVPEAKIENIFDSTESNGDPKRAAKRPRSKEEKLSRVPARRLSRWATNMSKKYDKEIIYSEEFDVNAKSGIKKFRNATYCKKDFKAGDLVKIRQNGEVHFGTIDCFNVRASTDGVVRYYRMPEKVFGRELIAKPTRHLVKEQLKEEIRGEYVKYSQEILENYPDSLIFNFDTGEFEEIDFPPKKNVQSGYYFPDCYIQILGLASKNKKAKSLTIVKKDVKKHTLVVCQIMQHYNMKKNEWVTDQTINGTKEYQCPPLSSKYHDKGTYYFKPVNITALGQCRLVFAAKIRNKTEWIVSKTFEMNVTVGSPAHLLMPRCQVTVLAGVRNEEVTIPLEIKDDLQNIFSYDKSMKIVPRLVVSTGDVKEEISKNVTGKTEIKYLKEEKKYVACNFVLRPRPRFKIPTVGLEIKMTLEVRINDGKELKGNITFLLMPGTPRKIKLVNKQIKVENHTSLKGVEFVLLDEFSNKTDSREGVSKLVFTVEKSEHFAKKKTVCYRESSGRRYTFNKMRISVPWNQLGRGLNTMRTFHLNYKVEAMDGEEVSSKVKALCGNITLTPSVKVQSMQLCRSLQTRQEPNEEKPIFSVEVGKRNKIFVVFLNDMGKPVKVVDENIRTIYSVLHDGKKHPIKTDENGARVVEIDLPGKMDSKHNCYVECKINQGCVKKLRKDFIIDPIFGDPVAWDISFVDSVKSGGQLNGKLFVWLIDCFENRMNVNDLENPMESNPILISSCDLTNVKPVVNASKGCFEFPEGIVSGEVGRHTIRVDCNKDYEIKGSRDLSFNLECGFPAKLVAKVFKKQTPLKTDDLLPISSVDVVSFEVKLEDSFGNLVTKGKYFVGVTIEKGVAEKLEKSFRLQNGKCEGKLSIKAKKEFIGGKLSIDFSLNKTDSASENIKSVTKELLVEHTTDHVVALMIDNYKERIIRVNEMPPVIRCQVVLEDETKEYGGDLRNFSLMRVGSSGQDIHYGTAEKRGQYIVFHPLDTIKSLGRYEFAVLHTENRKCLPTQTQSAVLVIQVLPGKPNALVVIDSEKHQTLSAGRSPKNGLIAKKIELGICDASGERLPITEMKSEMFPKIAVRLIASGKRRNLPKVKYSGYFNQILDLRIEEGSGECEGECGIEFGIDGRWALQNRSSVFSALKPTYLKLILVNDSIMLQKQKSLEKDKNQLEKRIVFLEEQLKPSEDKKKEIQSLSESMKAIKLIVPKLCSVSKEEASTTMNQDRRRIRKLVIQNQIPAELPRFNNSLTSTEGYIGRAGEIVSVESVGVARCLMYILGSKLNIHLTRGANSKASKLCVEYLKQNKGISYLDIELLPKKNFQSVLPPGNKLPHEGRFECLKEDAPMYLVHKLRINEGVSLSRPEFERIFAYFLGRTMVMGNFDKAIEYERRCVQRNIYCSTILTTDGYSVHLVKHAIPEFQLMRKKKRGIKVDPIKLKKRLKEHEEETIPKVNKFFEIRQKKKELESEQKKNSAADFEMENELTALKRRKEEIEVKILRLFKTSKSA